MKAADISVGDRLTLKPDNPYGFGPITVTVSELRTRGNYKTPWVIVAGVGAFKPSDFRAQATKQRGRGRIMTVTLATFPLPDRDGTYWQVNVNGMPVTRETESQADAVRSFERVATEMTTHARKVSLRFWDGFNAQETTL